MTRPSGTGFRSSVLVSALSFCLTIALTHSTQAQAENPPAESNWSLELFAARVPIPSILPECGSERSVACGYDLTVIARRSRDPLGAMRDSHPDFALLPAPLLGSVILDHITAPQECPFESLAADLDNARKNSLDLGEVVLVWTTSHSTAECFGFASNITNSEPRTILLWKQGRIRGWLDCEVGVARPTVCSLRLSSASDVIEGVAPLEVEVSGIANQNIGPAIRNIDHVMRRIYEIIEATKGIEFAQSPLGDRFHFDESTISFMDEFNLD